MAVNCTASDKAQCKQPACIWDDAVKCSCAPGYGGNGQSADSCAPCTGKKYKIMPDNSTCIDCPSKQYGESPTSTDIGNTQCVCDAGYEISGQDCVECKDSKYKPVPANLSCQPCGEGNYTAPPEGSASGVTNQTGPNTQCLSPKPADNPNSSTSPLAIGVIFALIISILVVIAAVTVMIKRKRQTEIRQSNQELTERI